MHVHKEPIDAANIRTIPATGFSWVDRRFVREGIIDRLQREAILLYFFLISVGDARGMSFYADSTVMATLKINTDALAAARQSLISERLILYRYPLYQVLPIPQKAPLKRLPAHQPIEAAPAQGDFMSLGEFLKFASMEDWRSGSRRKRHE